MDDVSKKDILPQNSADGKVAIRLDPDLARAYKKRAEAYQNIGKYDLSIAEYTEAIKLDPDNEDLYYGRTFSYKRTGDHKSALADHNEIIRLNPMNGYYARADAYNDMGDYDSAIADYTTIIERCHDNIGLDVYYYRGNVYLNKGEYDLAIADFTEAIRRGSIDGSDDDDCAWPDVKSAYLKRAIAYKNKGDYDQAIADSTEVIKRCPEDTKSYNVYTEPYHFRAGVYLKIGDVELAVADYVRAIMCDDDPARYTSILADCTEAINIAPNDAVAYRVRGDVHATACLRGGYFLINYSDYNRFYDLAVADYTEALRLDPDNNYLKEAIPKLNSNKIIMEEDIATLYTEEGEE